MVLGDSSGEAAKKMKEKKVLTDVLKFCLVAGGAKARNARLLDGKIDSSHERPDLIVTTGSGTVIGLEHFCVYHHISHDKKSKSKSAELDAYMEKRRQAILHLSDEDKQLEEMARLIAQSITHRVQDIHNSCLDDLITSFRKRLISEEYGHLPKVAFYRENIARTYTNFTTHEFGFLIEIRTDFGGLFLDDDYRVRQLKTGEMPLFDDIFDMLEAASAEVDWILLGFYPSHGAEIVNAAVLDCRNNKFKQSCKKQGLRKTTYLGLGKTSPFRKQKNVEEPTVVKNGDQFDLTIGSGFQFVSQAELFSNVLEDTATALNLYRKKRQFTATIPVQMVFEALRSESKTHRFLYKPEYVLNILRKMPEGVIRAYFRDFGRRYLDVGKTK